jgi:UDP-N-acetylglucosamine 2-epimerase (non-hydrolysing)
MVTPHNLLFIFGTRPEAIKLAPVVKEAVRDPAFRVEACATAQQREMLDQMLQIFEVTSVYDLGLMTDDQSLFGLTGDAIVGIEKVLAEVTRDLVIVQGDTTTTIGAALGTFYRKVPVAYVEAVLRTH